MSGRWVVSGVPSALGDGGSVRAHYIFGALAERTGATVIERGGGRALAEALVRRPSTLGARLAAAQLLRTAVWPALRRLVRPAVLDLFDHPALQREAMGLPLPAGERRTVDRAISAMVRDFERVVVVSDSFGDLVEVPTATRVTVPNGTDTRQIQPEPYHGQPVVGMASGAAPGRGIETLIDAVRRLRSTLPEARVRLAVAPSGVPSSADYLERLRRDAAATDWIEVERVPYARLGEFLGGCSVLTVLLPAGEYWDVASPVKLFDSMAAARPVVVTPRRETARIVTESGAGVVSASDGIDDIAAALAAALSDSRRATAMGEAGRRAAQERFDWRVLSARLADVVLAGGAS